jgi:predicted secreted protein with PEFG-CTERM motif
LGLMKTKAISSIFVLFAIAAGMASMAPAAFADHAEVAIVTVDESGFSQSCVDEGCYVPLTATVDVGGVVTMTNTDPTGVHTFTSGTVNGFTPSPDGTFDSSVLMSGDAFEWIPESAGEVPYYCMLHTWMIGSIIVQEAAAEEHDDDHAAEEAAAELAAAEAAAAEAAAAAELAAAEAAAELAAAEAAAAEAEEAAAAEAAAAEAAAELAAAEAAAAEAAAELAAAEAAAAEAAEHEAAEHEAAEHEAAEHEADVELMVVISDSAVMGGTQVELEFSELHVNYDIIATQNGEIVFEETGLHSMEHIATHQIDAVGSDENPIDVEIISLGIGAPDHEDDWTGPVGQVATAKVVPEFGTIAMMVLAVAIISIIAVTAKSRIVPRF